MNDKIDVTCQKQNIQKCWEDCEDIIRFSLESILNNKFDNQEQCDLYIRQCIETIEAILPVSFEQSGVLLFWINVIRYYISDITIIEHFQQKIMNSMLFAMKISSEIIGDDGKFLIHPLVKVDIDREDGTFGVVYIDKNLRMKVITNGFLNKSNSKLYNYRTKFWEKYLEDNHAEDK